MATTTAEGLHLQLSNRGLGDEANTGGKADDA